MIYRADIGTPYVTYIGQAFFVDWEEIYRSKERRALSFRKTKEFINFLTASENYAVIYQFLLYCLLNKTFGISDTNPVLHLLNHSKVTNKHLSEIAVYYKKQIFRLHQFLCVAKLALYFSAIGCIYYCGGALKKSSVISII